MRERYMTGMYENETIAAIATGMTDAGIGIIRISGEKALEIGNSIFRSPSGKEILQNAASHVLKYGYVVDSELYKHYRQTNDPERKEDWKNCVIDEAMAVVMKAPRSFTGEDTVEIQCHGGAFVMQKILEEALKNGARLADPGEFTKRAFLNGRIDLTRAEAVMDLIRSQNEYALSSSVKQLQGSLEAEIRKLRDEVLYEIAFIESALDDPEHISLEGYSERLKDKLDILSERIFKLISTADEGRLIREGVNTVIVGKPNAGKSSLLNLFTGEERAIVTEIPGTTRDVLRESVRLGGITFQMTDTAGIRDTEDTVERIGVERAEKYARDADLVLYVVDGSVPLDENDRRIVSVLDEKRVIILLNKSDICSVVEEADLRGLFSDGEPGNFSESEKIRIIRISAKDGEGMEEFCRTVREMFFHGKISQNTELLITNIRHREALQKAYDSLLLVIRSIEDGMPEDFYSIDLMNAYASLGRIIGEEVDDDLVEEIFSKFCMGK